MSRLEPSIAAVFALIERDWRLFISYRMRFVTQLLSAMFALLLFYYLSRIIGGGVFATPDEYFAFAVVGLVIMQVLASTLSTLPTAIRQELVAGTLERLVLSPLGPVASIVSMSFFPFAFAFVMGTITIVAAAALFGMPIVWSTAPWAVPVAALAALAFAPFALFLSASVIVVKQAGAGAGFLVTGISLIGGFFFPVSVLPDWIEWTSTVQPFTPALELLRHLLVGAETDEGVARTTLKLLGFVALLFPSSLLAVRTSIRVAQKRGTIIEY